MLTMTRAASTSSNENKEDNEKLIAALLAAYAFTRSDVTRLATLLAPAYLAAMERAANRALNTVGASPSWEPSKQEQREASKQAEQAAEGIAATFAVLLEGFLRRADFEGLHDAFAGIAAWVHRLVQWKTPQIVNVTCGTGNDAGTGAVVDALLSGDVVDAEDPDIVVGADEYQVYVQPSESSNDLCASYAGKCFPLSSWSDIPSWPLHPACPHESVLVPL